MLEALNDANANLFNRPIVGAQVWRSDDRGDSWRLTHEEPIRQMVFTYGYYFGQIRVSPVDADQVWIMGVPILPRMLTDHPLALRLARGGAVLLLICFLIASLVLAGLVLLVYEAKKVPSNGPRHQPGKAETNPLTDVAGRPAGTAIPVLPQRAGQGEPPEFEVEFCFESVQDVPYEADWDLVGITGMGSGITRSKKNTTTGPLTPAGPLWM